MNKRIRKKQLKRLEAEIDVLYARVQAEIARMAPPQFTMTKEWCMRMAKLEDGCEVGVGRG